MRFLSFICKHLFAPMFFETCETPGNTRPSCRLVRSSTVDIREQAYFNGKDIHTFTYTFKKCPVWG